MILSRDYIHIRLAALPDNVVEKLLAQYQVSKEDLTPLTAQDVKEIEGTFQKHLPGKEDLLTQWFLMAMKQGRAYFPSSLLIYVDTAQWFFEHQKEPLFRELAQKQSEWVDRPLNPKNILQFTTYDVSMIRQKYAEVEAAAQVNKFPESLPYGATLFYDDGNNKILKITGEEAACDLAEGTDWCTQEGENAEHYLQAGPLYIIYRNQDKIAQLYLGDGPTTVELKNLKNRTWTPDPEIRQALIKSGLMANILELLSEDPLEFKNTILRFLGKQDDPALRKYCSGDPWLAFFYAAEVLRGRFFAGEDEIMLDSSATGDYLDLLRDRDPSGYQEFKEDYPGFFEKSGGGTPL